MTTSRVKRSRVVWQYPVELSYAESGRADLGHHLARVLLADTEVPGEVLRTPEGFVGGPWLALHEFGFEAIIQRKDVPFQADEDLGVQTFSWIRVPLIAQTKMKPSAKASGQAKSVAVQTPPQPRTELTDAEKIAGASAEVSPTFETSHV
jgi:hypothetical protein